MLRSQAVLRMFCRAASGTSAPTHVFGLEGRYAHALYSAASKEKKLDVVEKDLLNYESLLKTEDTLGAFVKNPTLKRADKQSAILAVAKTQKYDSLTQNLLSLLSENGRLQNSGDVIRAFKMIMSAHRGEVQCQVTLAKPLDKANEQKLEAALQGFLKTGQKLLLVTKVDPSLMGGMIVEIGDKFVDMSLSSKIRKYTNILEESLT